MWGSCYPKSGHFVFPGARLVRWPRGLERMRELMDAKDQPRRLPPSARSVCLLGPFFLILLCLE